MTDENHRHRGLCQARAAGMAAKQWGNVTRAQLREAGFSLREIDGMIERRELHPRHRGVYALGAPLPAPEARWAAAVLAAGKGAVLSHTSAAACHGLIAPRAVTEVTTPRQRRGDKTLKPHHRRRVEVTRRGGLPLTTVPQTLLDLAASGWPIDRLTHDAAASSLVSLNDLRTFAHNRRGEPGAKALVKALRLPHTRSDWEREFLRWIKTLDDIPQPIFNDPIGHLTVDCHWPDHDLVIELDTDQTHGTAWAERNDEERDDVLERRGKETVRVRRETWDRDALAAELRARLDPRNGVFFS